jgi:hypothetical protein
VTASGPLFPVGAFFAQTSICTLSLPLPLPVWNSLDAVGQSLTVLDCLGHYIPPHPHRRKGVLAWLCLWGAGNGPQNRAAQGGCVLA